MICLTFRWTFLVMLSCCLTALWIWEYIWIPILNCHHMSIMLLKSVISIFVTSGAFVDLSILRLVTMQLERWYDQGLIIAIVCLLSWLVFFSNDKKKIDSVVNRAARLICAVGCGTHTSPLLIELHWLPFSKRILFKLCLYVFKILPIRQITNIDTFKKHLKPFFLLNSVLNIKVLLVFFFLFLFVNCKRCDAAVNSAIK